ncbi:helix-turn-helix domain-containing protein [Qipengyuania profunda]|uniref:winged helix-turn-helix transcriptional regulator n=1 Tax=Qipengyuania profunda TaxID=3113984 RepID=UPI002A18A457|nr:helix-turn-helix domain-containing protein [Qipengyuania sp. HL-TH1]WPL56385.1 helix-turn-helix domain-containing protein [Qipengyuania sp. HL-TH5]
MELVGERWALLVVRELMFGARRFSDLRANLPGISAKVLTERLAGLEEAGVLNRRKLPPPVSAQVYELTEWGYRAEPLVQELGRWAAMSSRHDPTLPLSPVSLMLSMRTMFDPAKAAGMQATIGFDIGGETFVARMADGRLPIERADPGVAEAVFRAPGAPVLAGLLYGGVGAEELERDAGLVIEGDRDLALAYADIFELPAPIA